MIDGITSAPKISQSLRQVKIGRVSAACRHQLPGNNATMCEEELEMCTLKTQRLLSEAESLLKDIEEMLDWFTKTTLSRPRWHEVAGQADIQEDGDTLVIDGLRFVDAASKEDLERLIIRLK